MRDLVNDSRMVTGQSLGEKTSKEENYKINGCEVFLAGTLGQDAAGACDSL